MKRLTTISILTAMLIGSVGCKSDKPAAKANAGDVDRGSLGPLLPRGGGSGDPGMADRLPGRMRGGDGPDEGRNGAWRDRADLTPEQMQARREEMQVRREARRQEMLATYDADHDGNLSDAERGAMREARVTSMVDRLDSDHDGKVSKAEMEAISGGRGQPVQFTNLDLDKDGFLSVEELAKGGPGGPGGWRGRGGRGGPDGAGGPGGDGDGDDDLGGPPPAMPTPASK